MVSINYININEVNKIKETLNDLLNTISEPIKKIPFFKGDNKKQYHLNRYIDDLQSIITNLIPKNSTVYNIWSCIGSEGCYHELHTHSKDKENKEAMILYLNVSDQDGNFIYIDNNKEVNIKPEIGMKISFPVDTLHGSKPQGKGLRQTLNIDYEVNNV